MATRSYTVLRDARRADTRDPFRPHSVGPTLESLRSPPEPQVETAALSPRDVRDTARDPAVAAIAPVMPTSLIRPFAAEAQAGTTAWGISAVKADESPFTGAGVTIAVLDTGVEAGHPAFA